MSIRQHSRVAKGGSKAQPATTPGGYLTDGTRLFRCLESHVDGTVLLEDCSGLECIHLNFDEVASGMRLVKPA